MSNVDHPTYYNEHPSGVECIDIVEHFSFNIGNCMKYLWRAGLKSDNPIEDLEKARWYIDREIARIKRYEIQDDDRGRLWHILGDEEL